MNNKFISAEQAAAMIRSNSTLCTVGMTLTSAAESILTALENQFISSGEPSNLTFVHAAGQSNRNRGNQHLAHPKMVSRIIGSHWGLAPKWMELIVGNQVKAYCVPQGQMVHLYSAMAAGLPGRLSKVGLGTFVDPRIEGGKMNELTRQSPDLLEVVELKGEEFLFYPEIPLDTVIIRGTTADVNGNISFEEEAMKLEVLPAVFAARRYGGKVIAQVKYCAEAGTLNPKDVVVPGCFVDAIVVCQDPEQDHRQSSSFYFDPTLSGQLRSPSGQAENIPNSIRKMIGRIASRYLTPGSIINLGTGIPNDVVGNIIQEENCADRITITVESGIYGGTQEGGIDFGIGHNLDAMISHQDQMLYYNGAGVDITFMGAGELDKSGNVNSTKMGSTCPGAGGFIDITQSARHVIFCSTFTAKGLEVAFENEELHIVSEGQVKKLVEQVSQISYSGQHAKNQQQKMHFVTERAVFELKQDGVHLIEIAPGIDLERDILAQMEFTPIVSPNLKVIDAYVFEDVALQLFK